MLRHILSFVSAANFRVDQTEQLVVQLLPDIAEETEVGVNQEVQN